MSQLVLLNQDGTNAKKLNLVSLPDNYVIPENQTLSWRTVLEVSSKFDFNPMRDFREPMEAFFYLGSAWGQITCHRITDVEYTTGKFRFPNRYNVRRLTVTVQGNSVEDFIILRDKVMQILSSHSRYEVRNDFNPPPSLLEKLIKKIKRIFTFSNPKPATAN